MRVLEGASGSGGGSGGGGGGGVAVTIGAVQNDLVCSLLVLHVAEGPGETVSPTGLGGTCRLRQREITLSAALLTHFAYMSSTHSCLTMSSRARAA